MENLDYLIISMKVRIKHDIMNNIEDGVVLSIFILILILLKEEKLWVNWLKRIWSSSQKNLTN